VINSSLLENCKGYLNGQWRGAKSGKTIGVHNPASGERLADAPDMAEAETAEAVEAAADSLQRPVSIGDRSKWLQAIAELLIEHQSELSRIITLEQGKPLRESSDEVAYAAGFFSYYSENLGPLNPQILDRRVRDCQWTVYHRPAGVAAVITPWNFPLAMLAKKLSAAIGAGCSVVTKPSEITPLSSIALWRLFELAEIPAGRLNLVIGSPVPIGKVLCEHPAVRVISFTGSTTTGQMLMRSAATYVKRLALELGGNAPYVVFDDADLDIAVDSLLKNRFRAGGQTCVCANRIYVQRGLADRFTEAMTQRVRALRVGNGLDSGTDIGPLINRAAFDKVARHVRNALELGAIRLVGDDPPPPTHDWGCYYPPTVLMNVSIEMLACQEETFGPLLPISMFDDEEQAIELCNNSDYGLAAYLFTADAVRARRVVDRLNCGHVGLNTGSGPTPEAPFGGCKLSGFGREGGLEGLLEYCETQAVADGSPALKAMSASAISG